MARPATIPPQRQTWLLPSWALSLLVHLLFAGGVVSLVGTAGRVAEPQEEIEQELQVQLAPEPLAPPPFDPPQGSQSASKPVDAREPLPSLRGLDPPLDAKAPAAGPSPALGPVFSSKELDGALAPPKVQMPGVQGAVETKFFGTAAKGAKFVYVIDRSASMQQALTLAKNELMLSLQLLPPTAEYQVVYYDLQPRVLEFDGKAGFLLATTENKARTAKLMDTIRSEGGTDHMRAIKRAIALGPHVIYCLTDADEMKPAQARELTALNQRGSNARIHCIELGRGGPTRADSALRLLAVENRGEYRAIDPATLPRPR